MQTQEARYHTPPKSQYLTYSHIIVVEQSTHTTTNAHKRPTPILCFAFPYYSYTMSQYHSLGNTTIQGPTQLESQYSTPPMHTTTQYIYSHLLITAHTSVLSKVYSTTPKDYNTSQRVLQLNANSRSSISHSSKITVPHQFPQYTTTNSHKRTVLTHTQVQ